MHTPLWPQWSLNNGRKFEREGLCRRSSLIGDLKSQSYSDLVRFASLREAAKLLAGRNCDLISSFLTKLFTLTIIGQPQRINKIHKFGGYTFLSKECS